MRIESGVREMLADSGPPRNIAFPTDRKFDLLVIGGGIVGAGIARDAASRGLRTLLAEQSDFASGTSSRSSRLLHGGLRYLAQGRLGLVREASIEKLNLSRIAPHLCRPLPFVFPVWADMDLHLWQLSAGVRVYDLLCGGRNLGRSATLDQAQTLSAAAGLREAGLLGSTRHFDALTNDARLVIDTLLSASASGAVVRNYLSFGESTPGRERWECLLRDELTGLSLEVQARAIVNATGAWAPRLARSSIKLRLTKGVHLVIDRCRLPVSEAVVLTEGERILFVIPWGERIILGTTDTDFEGNPGDVRTSPDDVRYILKVVNSAFPDAGLAHYDVIAAWAGVRPLIARSRGKAGSPSDVSRKHVIRMAEPGWFDVAGGKLTTYRRIAEQTVDEIGAFWGESLPGSTTARTPIVQGRFSGVTPPAISADVVAEACREEWAVHLEDVMLRRTSWHYYHRDRERIARETAQWMASGHGWSQEQQCAEFERYLASAEERFESE